MKKAILFSIFAILTAEVTFADSYATFSKRRYYSQWNRRFVEIDEKKVVRLFLATNPKRPIWKQTIKEFPERVFVQDEGDSVILFEQYYGNNHRGEVEAVIFLNEKGAIIQTYRIDYFCELKNMPATTSNSFWCEAAYLSFGQQDFVVQTVKLRTKNLAECIKTTPREELKQCRETAPDKQFHFDVRTGKLTATYTLTRN